MIQSSRHADSRCRTRGVRLTLVHTIIENADIKADVGSGCHLLRVRRRTVVGLGTSDRLHCVAVIWSESRSQVVTVLTLHAGRSGRPYCKTR